MGRRILLVEGNNDKHVMMHICGNRGVPHLDEVRPHHNVEGLLEAVPVQRKATDEGDIVGVVMDADVPIRTRWWAMRDIFVNAGYQDVPDEPIPDGTILEAPAGMLLPRAGLWLMPDNRTNGILEDFLKFLVPQPSTLFEHVKSCVAAIPDLDRLFKPVKEPKAVLHTWLAGQKEPGLPHGTSISARFLDANVSQVDVLVACLKRLFFAEQIAALATA